MSKSYIGVTGKFRIMSVVLLSLVVMALASAQSVEEISANLPENKDNESAPGEVFCLIPDADLDLITKPTRRDMVIYMQADSIYKARNIYAGLSWIEELTDDYMKVHLTDVSSLQIKLLNAPKVSGRLAMTIYTIAGESETADSTIKFYALADTAVGQPALKEHPTEKFFTLPDPKLFYNLKNAPKDITMKSLLADMPFHTIAYDIAPDKNVLTGRLTISNYLTLEQRKQIEPYIRSELQWNWTGSKFKIEN